MALQLNIKNVEESHRNKYRTIMLENYSDITINEQLARPCSDTPKTKNCKREQIDDIKVENNNE